MKQMRVRSALSNESDQTVAYLYEAVARYVERRNGSVIVAGGIQLQQNSLEPKFNFRIAIACTGKPPTT